MTRRGISDRAVLALLFAATVGVVVFQVAWWKRRPPLLRVTPEVAPPVAARDTAPPPPSHFPYEAVGPARAPIAAAAVSSTRRVVAVLDDSGEVTVWDVRTGGRQIGRIASGMLPASRGSAGASAVPVPMAVEEPAGAGVEGALVAIGGSDGIFRVWRAATGKQLLAAPHSARDAGRGDVPSAPLVDAAISAKGRFISVSGNGSLAFWAERGAGGDPSLFAMTRGPRGTVRDVDISHTDGELALMSDSAVYVSQWSREERRWSLLDLSNGESDEEFHERVRADSTVAKGRRRGGSPQSVSFSPNSNLVVSVWSDGEIRFYRAETGEIVRELESLPPAGEGSGRKLIAYAPVGGLFAATDGDRAIQVWRLSQYTPPVTVTAPGGPVRSLWFTPDGASIVVSVAGERHLRRLPLPAGL